MVLVGWVPNLLYPPTTQCLSSTRPYPYRLGVRYLPKPPKPKAPQQALSLALTSKGTDLGPLSLARTQRRHDVVEPSRYQIMMSEDGGDDYQIVRMMMDGSMGEGAATPHLAHTTLVHHALHVHSSQSYASSETTALASVAQMKTERQTMQYLERERGGRYLVCRHPSRSTPDRSVGECGELDGFSQAQALSTPPFLRLALLDFLPAYLPAYLPTYHLYYLLQGHKRLLCPAQPPSSAQPLVLLDDNDNDNDNDYDNDDSRRPTTSSSALRIASTTLTS
ncbi:hypothetical protein IAQ61_010570 [Plenodomus lingam]|uniref:uncharacterized protein n=1 Tax=Leptosphaeria maculans TaxID=5022 RepID=UPI00332053F1|nr:hypothetical protein IAQ61_010570 [Plenodomus lingam]